MEKFEIKQKAVKGISWNLIEKFGVQGVNFIFGIVLARLLLPADFGLIGIVMVFFVIANVFVESGLGKAYVQKNVVSDEDSNTIFIFNLIFSLIIYSILWFSSPFISHFYQQPILEELIRLMGLVVIINSFGIVQIAHITRNLDFKRKTMISIFAVLFSGIVGIILAYKGFGVWSLVFQNIGYRLITTIGLWATSKWKPKLQFSVDSFKHMYSYGSWILLSSVITEIFNNIYILVIGKLFPFAQLGFYTKAKEFQQNSSAHLAGTIGTVSFPIFSKFSYDLKKLRSVVTKFLRTSFIFLFPISLILFVVAKPFILFLLSEKWSEMIPFLKLLCIVGITYPINLINIQVLLSLGHSRLNFNLGLIKNGLRIINLIISAKFGILYIIIGEIIISLVAIRINSWYTYKLLGYGLIKQLADIWDILIVGIIAGIISTFAVLLISNTFLSLISGIVITGFVYIIILLYIDKKLFGDISSSIKLMLHSSKGGT